MKLARFVLNSRCNPWFVLNKDTGRYYTNKAGQKACTTVKGANCLLPGKGIDTILTFQLWGECKSISLSKSRASAQACITSDRISPSQIGNMLGDMRSDVIHSWADARDSESDILLHSPQSWKVKIVSIPFPGNRQFAPLTVVHAFCPALFV